MPLLSENIKSLFIVLFTFLLCFWVIFLILHETDKQLKEGFEDFCKEQGGELVYTQGGIVENTSIIRESLLLCNSPEKVYSYKKWLEGLTWI